MGASPRALRCRIPEERRFRDLAGTRKGQPRTARWGEAHVARSDELKGLRTDRPWSALLGTSQPRAHLMSESDGIRQVLEDKRILDRLASIEHERWAHWQRYVHAHQQRDDGSLVIPPDLVARWERQIEA